MRGFLPRLRAEEANEAAVVAERRLRFGSDASDFLAARQMTQKRPECAPPVGRLRKRGPLSGRGGICSRRDQERGGVPFRRQSYSIHSMR